MEDRDAMQMMMRCRDEIRQQRSIIEALTPKAQAWDQLCKVLDLLPQPSQGYGEDLVWRLDKAIEEIKAAAVKPEPQGEVAPS